jgi:hypothetical protein
LRRPVRFFALDNHRRENVVLACQPRGGSTWLAEILAHLPRHKVIWEPFHPGLNHLAERNGLRSINYLTADTISTTQE